MRKALLILHGLYICGKKGESQGSKSIRPFTAETARPRRWKLDAGSAREDPWMACRAGRADRHAAGRHGALLPAAAHGGGSLEFSLMRVRGDIDQKVLSELLPTSI